MANVSFIGASKLSELIGSVDAHKSMSVRVLSSNQLVLGVDPFKPSYVIDLSNEKISPYELGDGAGISEQSALTVLHPLDVSLNGSKLVRRSGNYWFEIKGRRVGCSSLKELLSAGLCAIEKIRPGTFEKLSKIKLRSRRIVARNPKELFDREDLSKKYSEKLINDWWFGTNNSAAETNAWLERACAVAQLGESENFKTNFTITLADL